MKLISTARNIFEASDHLLRYETDFQVWQIEFQLNPYISMWKQRLNFTSTFSIFSGNKEKFYSQKMFLVLQNPESIMLFLLFIFCIIKFIVNFNEQRTAR